MYHVTCCGTQNSASAAGGNEPVDARLDALLWFLLFKSSSNVLIRRTFFMLIPDVIMSFDLPNDVLIASVLVGCMSADLGSDSWLSRWESNHDSMLELYGFTSIRSREFPLAGDEPSLVFDIGISANDGTKPVPSFRRNILESVAAVVGDVVGSP
jgi:hypothetical protein